MTAALHSGFQSQAICVGILASDPMRSIGLQAILEESLMMRTVLLVEGHLPKSGRPRLVVLDAGAHSGDTVGDSVEQLQRLLPSAPVVVMAGAAPEHVMECALAAGATGVLTETADIDEIRACIEAVLDGSSWLPSGTGQIALLNGDTDHRQPALSSRFTPKEREVLAWLTQGRSNREIAMTMHIDEATVKAHLGRMLRKAKATNRVELTLRVLAERASPA